MNDVRSADSWWPSSHVRGVALVLRILIPTSTMVALMCTSLAAGRTVLIVDAAIFGIALVCTVRPDSHVGLLVVMAVGVDWLATVNDRATPWSVGAAASLAVFHASMAAASVAPPAARSRRAMSRPLDTSNLRCDGCEPCDVGRRWGDPRPPHSQQRGTDCSVLDHHRHRRALGARWHLGRRTRRMNSRAGFGGCAGQWHKDRVELARVVDQFEHGLPPCLLD